MIFWTKQVSFPKKCLGYIYLIISRTKRNSYYKPSIDGLKLIPGSYERLVSLRNIHAGKRAFVLGTGPSLKTSDVNRLKNEIVFACNGIYKIYEELGWKPTYHTVIDRTQLEDRSSELNKLTGTTIFVPDFAGYCIKGRQNVIFLPFRWPDPTKYGYPKFSEDAAAAVWDGMTVTISNLQLAYHMGITEVILLGIDFSYDLAKMLKDGETELKGISSSPDHFIKDYYSGSKRFVNFYPDLQKQSYELSNTVFAADSRKIINASRETKLEVFERVDFDSLF